MDSWWELGEGGGYRGDELAVHQISCAFCLEQGNFETVAHFVKRNPQSGKTLNFDTLKCGNCAGYVMVLWSASQRGLGGMHNYTVLPWSKRLEKHPDHWPKAVGRHWIQAHRSLTDESWDAAADMARSSMQAAMRDQGAVGKRLVEEIDDLAGKGLLPPLMKDWSHEVRELGNDSSHPEPDDPKGTDPKDARDIVNFLDYLLEYLYDLPKRIENYRARPR
jgi:hypothetical protein